MTLHDYLQNLSSGRSKSDRDAAIFTLGNELGLPRRLVMPGEGMSCWKGAAFALKLMGRPALDEALPDMMEWLRDMSWPGAEEIRRLLLSDVPRGNLAQLIENAAGKAVSQGDSQWLSNLAGLLASAGLDQSDFLDPQRYRALLSAIPD